MESSRRQMLEGPCGEWPLLWRTSNTSRFGCALLSVNTQRMLEGSLCEREVNTENQNRKLGVGMPVWERLSQDDQSFRTNPTTQ